ncbi:MAG: hypothetical protein Phog2KO_30980 [Phototrophicaceae bacterium]
MHKEKRKTNPLRRVLIKLIFGLVLIVSVLAVGIQALRPTGAQIVYIAPDDNGYDAIWLADVNNPEHPRQLTHHEEMSIGNLQVSQENSIVFYRTYPIDNSIPNEFRTINLDTGDYQILALCEVNDCRYFQLHPSGEWIAYQEYEEDSVKVVIQNLEGSIETSERREVFETEIITNNIYQPLPKWVGNTNALVFRVSGMNSIDEFAFYDIDENQIIETKTLNVPYSTPNFSDDGSFYSSVTIQSMYPSSFVDPRLPFIRNIQNLEQLIYEAPSSSDIIADWHSNNVQVLLNRNGSTYASELIVDTYLYNISTGESDLLFTVEDNVPRTTFNTEGTQILYTAFFSEVNLYQIMLFDMESREEITLPIVGGRPQWVNGGQ